MNTESVLCSYVTVCLYFVPLCISYDLIPVVISGRQKGSARHSVECQGPSIKVSLHCPSTDILHLRISASIAGALRRVRMVVCKSTNELPPPFFSFARFYFTFMFLFLFRVSSYWLHVSIPGLLLVFFTDVALFHSSLSYFSHLWFSFFLDILLSHSLSIIAFSFRFPLLRHLGPALSKSEVKNKWRHVSTAAGKAQFVWWQGYGLGNGIRRVEFQ
jgi:hypothetical protein